MAPDDLNLTVDFNDASFEDESSDDAYIPETWASNRNSTGDNASMAVLGAGSQAAEFIFDFDDASFDNDPDSDIGIESDMEVKDIAEIVWEQIKANDAKIQAAKSE